MREIIIVILVVIVGFVMFSSDIINTDYNSNEYYYKVDKIEPYRDNEAIYNINTRKSDGSRGSMEGRYDNLQIIDTVGAFNVGDEVILVPTKRIN